MYRIVYISHKLGAREEEIRISKDYLIQQIKILIGSGYQINYVRLIGTEVKLETR